jgi:dihydrofolate reductase
MRKLNYIMHISLDGYYADSNGNMRWVHMDDTIGAWVHKVIEQCETAVYGRVTFQMMESFWPTVEQHPDFKTSTHLVDHARWVNPAQKIVFSKTLNKSDWANTTFVSQDAVGFMKNLKNSSGKDIAMMGSASVAQLFISHGLIDDYWMTINPVTLGAGQALFSQPLKLHLIEKDTKIFPNGSIGVHYSPLIL